MSEYLRITGRPKIDKDSSGLRRITRTYIVQGEVVTEDRVEEEVFLPYGTPDIEYHDAISQDLENGGLTSAEVTGAYLVEQSLAPGSNINEAILTRVYQELDSTPQAVEVGATEVTRGASDRLTVKKTFIVKNPYSEHYAKGRIGVDTVEVEGSICYLGTVQSKETEVYTEFIEVYYQDGVLSESIQYRYGQYPNHNLEIRTLRSVDNIAEPPSNEGPSNGPWFLIDEKEGPGDDNFGQLGKTVKTAVYAKGYGLVSSDEEVKGKEPNTVNVTTIKFLTSEGGSVPNSAIPSFTRRTFESVEEKEGYELHTIRGIVLAGGSGVVEVSADYKFGQKPDHKLEVARAVAYGAFPTSNDVRDFLYPSGDPTSLGNYVVVGEKENTQGEFDVYTIEFARGSGEISRTSRNLGQTTVVEIVTLHPISENISTEKEGTELLRKLEILDGYKKLTVETSDDDSGVVDSREETKNNGALSIITITQLGDSWNSSNTPSGYNLIAERDHRFDRYPAITRTYAKGYGEIKVGESEGDIFLTTQYVRLAEPNTSFNFPLGAVDKETVEEDGFVRYSWKIKTPYDAVESTNVRLSSGLKTTTYSKLNEDYQDNDRDGSIIEKDQRFIDSTNFIGKVSYVESSGFENERIALSNGLKTTTKENYVEDKPNLDGPGAYEQIAENLFKRTEISFEPSESRNKRISISGGVKTVTTTDIESEPINIDQFGGSTEELAKDIFRNTKIEVTSSPFSNKRVSISGGVKTTSESFVSDSATDIGINGGSFEQIAEGIFRNTLVSVESTPFENKRISVSGGIKTTTETTIDETSLTVGDHGGSTEQLSEDLFRNTSITIEPTHLENKRISVSGGIKTVTETSIGDQGTVGEHGGSVEEIAAGIFRNTTIEKSATQFSSKSINISGGLRTTSITNVGSSPAEINKFGGSFEEIAEGIFRNTTIDKKPTYFESKTISYSSGIITTTTGSVGASKNIGVHGGSSEEIAEGIYRSTTISKSPVGAVSNQVTAANGGAVFVTKQESTDDPGGSKFKGNRTVGADGEQIYNNITYSPGEYETFRKYIDSSGATVIEKEAVVSEIPSAESYDIENESVSFSQVAPGVWIKKTVEATPDEEKNVIKERTYYDEGLEFREIIYFGEEPRGRGNPGNDSNFHEVDSTEEKVFISGTQETRYRKVYAKINENDRGTEYGTYDFTVPGVIKFDRTKGILSAPPRRKKILVENEISYSDGLPSNIYVYEAPSATMDVNITFKDATESYSKFYGDNNYCFASNTTAAAAALPKEDEEFLGQIVNTVSHEKIGDSEREYLTRLRAYPINITSKIIYSKNGFKVYKIVRTRVFNVNECNVTKF